MNVSKDQELRSVSLISLGCPRTLVDSEMYLGRLKQDGFKIIDDAESSDVVVINTCSFIEDAIKESVDTVLQAIELKKSGKVKAVIVAGCLVQRFKDGVIQELPEVDGFVGVDGFDDINTVVNKALRGKPSQSLRPKPNVLKWEGKIPRVPLSPSHYAYLKISEGCMRGCSFCVIPKIKGPMVSRSIEDLVDEAQTLVDERGLRELIVVGQDTSDYGLDRYGKVRTHELLRELGQVKGIDWIRLLYCHPKGISDELIAALRDVPSICKYLDMAIEHADDTMLKAMNRHMNQAQLRDRIEKLRKEIPGITLRTSIIVGFPGETDAMFENMLQFLEEVRFERLGAFTYSPEQGSAAFGYKDAIPQEVKQERFDRVMQVQQVIAEELNQASVGKEHLVMIDEPDPDEPNQYIGRTTADCPEVDGLVYVSSKKALKAGQIVPVQVTDNMEYDLIGHAIES